MNKAYLVLENSKVFEGCRIGADGETLGELVFTTGVVGYLETLTDPSYAGQIVMQTFPQMPAEFESKIVIFFLFLRRPDPRTEKCQQDRDRAASSEMFHAAQRLDRPQMLFSAEQNCAAGCSDLLP